MHTIIAKSLLKPDNGYNVYRGCDHGCIYCDSRSLCYGFKHDFADIEVKVNAPELLRAELSRRRKKCVTFTGSMSDPYNGAERELLLTRRCLETTLELGFGVCLLTKSDLLLRDLDLLKKINTVKRCVVCLTLTTADDKLCRLLEPAAPLTSRRAEALAVLAANNIPTLVWLCPTLPFINDDSANLLNLLDICRRCGVKGIVNFGFNLTLRAGSREYYYEALERLFPRLKEKYACLYGNAYILKSPHEDALNAVFVDYCRRYGIVYDTPACIRLMRGEDEQLSFL